MIPFKHPTTFLLSGGTGSEKTFFVLRILDNIRDLFESTIRRIWFCYGEWQPAFEEYKSFVHFHKGLPQAGDPIFDGKKPSLLILDDLMGVVNAFVADIFTKLSHHRDLSVIYLCQNLFDKNKFHRAISLNTHYIVLLRNARDTQPVAALARQVLRAIGALPRKRTVTLPVTTIITYFSIYIPAPKIDYVYERIYFRARGHTPI